jgi:O-acetylhomoserine (thiol)-lyase
MFLQHSDIGKHLLINTIAMPKSVTTRILETPFTKEDPNHPLSMPVYNTAAYEFATAEEMEAAFIGQTAFHTYTRISNPTVEFFEQSVKNASGAMAVTALSSGMAAISNVMMSLAYNGANIVTTSHLFGNTFSLFQFTLAEFGVEIRFCDLLNIKDVEKNIDKNTCLIFTEVITNPHLEVVDLKALSELAKRKHVPLVVDTTVVPWNIFKARDFGVDIEVVSSTKYISGGATGIGGLVLDHGTFDWNYSHRLKANASKFGAYTFYAKLRGEVFRNLGACMSPQIAAQQTLGLETMELRFNRAADTGLQLAQWLQTQPGVKHVNHNSLENNLFYEISLAQFGKIASAMFTFQLKNREACYRFINKLKLIRRATNLFDNKSLIIHPLSTIYGTLSPEMKEKMGVPDNLLRFSTGLEDLYALKADILQALS